MEEQVQQVEQVEQKTNKNLSTLGKYTGLGAALAGELMVGFWFAAGTVLAIKMVNSLQELISRK